MARPKAATAENKAVEIPKGNVIVIGTDKSPFLKTGKEFTVSSELAQTLIKKGSATLK